MRRTAWNISDESLDGRVTVICVSSVSQHPPAIVLPLGPMETRGAVGWMRSDMEAFASERVAPRQGIEMASVNVSRWLRRRGVIASGHIGTYARFLWRLFVERKRRRTDRVLPPRSEMITCAHHCPKFTSDRRRERGGSQKPHVLRSGFDQ